MGAIVIPELISHIISYLDAPRDLLNCACINWTWNALALQKLYRGSMNDTRYRTPDILSLNVLFEASQERFTRNMSFVKHLTLAPNVPDPDRDFHLGTRLACLVKCHALQDRSSAELLLRPGGAGPTSIAMPFELMKHSSDFSTISDLILTPQLEFLTIDHKYLELLSLTGEHCPIPVLSSLKALSIHRSGPIDIKKLCAWLDCCDLHLFQLHDGQDLDSHSELLQRELFQRLWRHRNLQVIALSMSWSSDVSHRRVGMICAELERETKLPWWPKLRGLYLSRLDKTWTTQLPTFSDLQILKQPMVIPTYLPNEIPDETVVMTTISKCRNLKVIEIELSHMFDDKEFILELAKGCPQLRHFNVSSSIHSDLVLEGEYLSELFRYLPHLEVLSLGFKTLITGTKLQDLSTSCPNLQILKLGLARLQLSLSSLQSTQPLKNLKIIHLRQIWFHDSSLHLRTNNIPVLATAWSSVFPLLSHLPCPADIYALQYNSQSPYPTQISSTGFNEEDRINHSNLEFQDQRTNFFICRNEVWKYLEYKFDSNVCEQMIKDWNSEFEIRTSGYPVLPLSAFVGVKRT